MRLRSGVLVGAAVSVIALSACAGRDPAGAGLLGQAVPSPGVASGVPVVDSPPPESASASPTGTPTGAPGTPSGTLGAATAAGLSEADVAAGLTSRRFPSAGSGRFVTVPGGEPAPGTGRVVAIRVKVESGLPVDGAAFARFVMDTLNDPRSWGHGGRLTFARTTSRSALRVVLATPDTSAALCRPLVTYGRLSCRAGDSAVLTMYRWVNGTPGYRNDLTGYRHYVVNHEVGHLLGHGHLTCPGTGRPAPLMMQQTKGLMGCRPNPWPYP